MDCKEEYIYRDSNWHSKSQFKPNLEREDDSGRSKLQFELNLERAEIFIGLN
jgi:hypothetical protein